MKVRGGKRYYGEAIGIALFDQHPCRPSVPGCVGNASSYRFPVRLKIITGVNDNPFPPLYDDNGHYSDVVRRTVDTVRLLEADGVRAVVTCCGFFSIIQHILAREASIPVFTSPLLLAPVIARMIGPDRQVGILAASKEIAKPEFLEPVGIDERLDFVVAGLESSREFMACYMGGKRIDLDTARFEAEVVAIARSLVHDNPRIGALLLECTDLPPYAAAIQKAVNLPVFDYIGFINTIYQAVVQQPYSGFI